MVFDVLVHGSIVLHELVELLGNIFSSESHSVQLELVDDILVRILCLLNELLDLLRVDGLDVASSTSRVALRSH